MTTQALHSAPTPALRQAAFATTLSSRLRQSLLPVHIRFAQWNERRRIQSAYRRDLVLLAGLGERELADFGAPGWLRADVQRYR